MPLDGCCAHLRQLIVFCSAHAAYHSCCMVRRSGSWLPASLSGEHVPWLPAHNAFAYRHKRRLCSMVQRAHAMLCMCVSTGVSACILGVCAQVKFNVNRVDNMVIQAIALLDTLDKDINTFVMRVREWYSWHFPSLSRSRPLPLPAYVLPGLFVMVQTSLHR